MLFHRSKKRKIGRRKRREKTKRGRRKTKRERRRKTRIRTVKEKRRREKIVLETMMRLRMWILWKVLGTKTTKKGRRTKRGNIGSGIRAQPMMLVLIKKTKRRQRSPVDMAVTEKNQERYFRSINCKINHDIFATCVFELFNSMHNLSDCCNFIICYFPASSADVALHNLQVI